MSYATPVAMPAEPERIPFNQALLRASANHPKSRRLSMGYCDPPDKGTRGGGEVRGDDLLSTGVDASRWQGEKGEDGRINLDCENGQAAGICLICRAGVSGWLRIYTG